MASLIIYSKLTRYYSARINKRLNRYSRGLIQPSLAVPGADYHSEWDIRRQEESFPERQGRTVLHYKEIPAER